MEILPIGMDGEPDKLPVKVNCYTSEPTDLRQVFFALTVGFLNGI